MTAATTTTRPPELMAALRRVTGDEKHSPAAYSTLDVLWVLYDRVLRIDPACPDDPDRDRFLLSKGHGPAAYYAVLATKGFMPASWLDGMAGPASRLGHHPDRLLIPGVEISSGSLGHGLGLAVGTALGLRAQGFAPRPKRGRVARERSDRAEWSRAGRVEGAKPRASGASADWQGLLVPHVYVLIGDAELDEGSNHEAIAYAGATGLANLTAIVIDNESATHGWPGGIASRFTVNGWTAATVDGRDHDDIAAGLLGRSIGHPHVVVARIESKS